MNLRNQTIDLIITNKEGEKSYTKGFPHDNKIYIYDSNAVIDNGYLIDYSLENGLKKTVVVIKPGYYGNFKNHSQNFPDYQCEVQDIEEYNQAKINKAQNITIENKNGSVIIGNVTNSPITINTSISELEKEINEKGGSNKEELLDLLEQVKELCENMEKTKSIPKSKSLMKKITNHISTNNWFYKQIVEIIGAVVIKIMQGN